jgi:hypothetical protein
MNNVFKKSNTCVPIRERLSADGLTWLQRNSYQRLCKCSSGYNNIPIYVVLGILSTRLDKISKATSPLTNHDGSGKS